MHSKEEIPPRGLAQRWGLAERGRRGPEPRYSAGEVARAGVELADRAGLDAVTLASVAAELGLTTTALYRYVDTKHVLVELMVDVAIGEPPPLTGETWRDRAAAWAYALAAAYRRHPWLVRVTPGGVPRRPGMYAWLEAMVDAVDGAAGVDAMRLALLLDAVVRGFSNVDADPSPPPEWLTQAIAQRHPRLAAQLARDWADTDDEFAHAVTVVLRGALAPGA